MKPNLIALLTDFGLSDPYVGIMKGVIKQIGPDLETIDLTHQLPPGDIQSGAFHLWQSAPFFPEGTVFLVVVDPGVGSARKGLFYQRGDQIFIGPDNGIFTYVGFKNQAKAWELSNPELHLPIRSRTFHGRDIFAPAAAWAALGIRGEQFGGMVDSPIQLPHPYLHLDETALHGEVIHIDRFGNLITSLGQFHPNGGKLEMVSWISDIKVSLPVNPTLILDQSGTSLPLVSTYTEIEEKKCAALIGSSKQLEIAANQASAAEMLGLKKGDRVTFIWK